MATPEFTIQMDNQAVQEMVKKTVQANIAAAFQEHGIDIASKIIDLALKAKVKEDGSLVMPGDWQYSKAERAWFDHEVDDFIRKMARSALWELLRDKREVVVAEIKKQFEKKAPLLADAMVDAAAESIGKQYGFKFDVKACGVFELDKEDTEDLK